MRKVVVASDSFKGSLSSSEVAEAVCDAIHHIFPECNVVKIDMADGGEGMLASLKGAIEAIRFTTEVHDPLGRPVEASYLISSDTAIIEMAQASGLTLLKEEERNPLITSSYGTGEIIMDAFRKGCRRFIIGIGGSATNDGGTGMLEALGFRFYDRNGNPVTGCNGELLNEITSAESSNVEPELLKSEFLTACDVEAYFTGQKGATHIFARQKGADQESIALLEKGMLSFERIIESTTGVALSEVKGSGAAGGIGGALHAFLKARLISGAELILDMISFEELIKEADLVITGEGRIDCQTLMGKAPARIAARATAQGINTIAIGGSVSPEMMEDGRSVFKAILPICGQLSSPEEIAHAMIPETAKTNIKQTIIKYMTVFH